VIMDSPHMSFRESCTSATEVIPGNLRLPWQLLASLLIACLDEKFAKQTLRQAVLARELHFSDPEIPEMMPIRTPPFQPDTIPLNAKPCENVLKEKNPSILDLNL
jgi:hypothetical protein